jgi:DNA-binding SARP family transcriptional activator/Tol biopolymer transport system component
MIEGRSQQGITSKSQGSSGGKMLVIELLGTLSLRADAGSVPLVAQQKRPLGLLAVLALGGKQGLARPRIEAYLWPESPADRAAHALNQAVYAIRQSLGDDVIISTARDLRLNPQLVDVDVWQFDEAIAAKQWERAAGIYRGTLLDGAHFGDSRELESLIDANRARLRQEYHRAVELLANASSQAGDHLQSVTWWRSLANSDPLSSHATKNLMLALAAAGDRAGALKQARLYQELVRQDLEMEPDSQIEALALSLGRPAAAIVETAASPTGEKARNDRTPGRKPGTRRDRIGLFAAIPIAVLMTGAAILGWMRPASPKPVVRYKLVVDSTEAIAKLPSWSGRLALSPDGSRLAYFGGPKSQLLIRSLDELHATAIPGTEGMFTPFFSPDGKQVGFLEDRRVQIASIAGGPAITVSDTLNGESGASWGPDGFIYLGGIGEGGGDDGALLRVRAKAGSRPEWFTVLDTAKGEVLNTWPDALPNGKGVLFTVWFSGKNGVKGSTSHAIAVAEVPSGKHRVLIEDAIYARYASSGHILYVTADKTMMVVPFDQNSMKITGEPIALTPGIEAGFFGSADLAISATGTLVYSTGAGQGRQELVWVTRDGKVDTVDPDWSGDLIGSPALSPDGKRVAVTRTANTEKMAIWIKRLDRGTSIRLPVDARENFGPAWSPDGKSVTFTSKTANGSVYLSTQRADGGAPGVVQLRLKENVFNARWSPDGKWLIFQTDVGARAGDILAIRPGTDTAPTPLVATAFTETSPALSFDGRWLAYCSNESGKNEIYVVPFPNTSAGKWAISTGGGTEPLWSHRGTELFYRDASRNLVAVAVNTNPTFSFGRATVLFPAGGYTSRPYTPQYAVAPDDRRFLMIRPLESGSPDNIIVVHNWFEELKSGRPKERTGR